MSTTKIDWYYHRKNCNTCSKAEAFFAERSVQRPEYVIANKVKFNPAQAAEIAREAEQVWATKGKAVLEFDPRDPGQHEAMLAALIGPSGTLRAPAIRAGGTLLVGFDDAKFREIFGE